MVGHEASKRREPSPFHADSTPYNVKLNQQLVCGTLKEPVTRVFARQKRPRHEGRGDGAPASSLHFTDADAEPSRPQAALTATPTARRATATARKSKLCTLPTGAKKATQLYLNCGQTNFDGTTCSQCGMYYASGVDDDEREHASYHAEVTKGIKAKGLNDAVALPTAAGKRRLVVVNHDCHRTPQGKVRQISSMMHEQLDLQDPNWLLSVDSKVYLCITGNCSDTDQVVGAAVAQRIQRAWRCTAGPQQLLSPRAVGEAGATSAKASQRSSLLCSLGVTPAGFVADSEDVDRQAVQSACCTPAQRNGAAGGAGSPSGTPTPCAQGVPMREAAALATPCRVLSHSSQQHRAGGSSVRRQKVNTLASCWGSSQQLAAAATGSTQAPPAAVSGTEAASQRLDHRLAAAADGEVTSPRVVRQPLTPLLSTPAAATAHVLSANMPPLARAPEAGSSGTAAPAGLENRLVLPTTRASPLRHRQVAGGAAATATPKHHQQQLGTPSHWHRHRERAECGVRALWVAVGSRRQGIATALLDAARQDMVYGYLLKHDQVAFSPLTQDGLRFAQAYVGRPDVLLYDSNMSR